MNSTCRFHSLGEKVVVTRPTLTSQSISYTNSILSLLLDKAASLAQEVVNQKCKLVVATSSMVNSATTTFKYKHTHTQQIEFFSDLLSL